METKPALSPRAIEGGFRNAAGRRQEAAEMASGEEASRIDQRRKFHFGIGPLAATVIFICLGFTAENTEGAKDGTVAIIARIGITLSGIALGFCLGNCWAEYKRGNSRWVKAMEIDQHVVVEIAKTVRDYRDTATSLSMLSTSDDHETYKRSLYFLIQRRHSFRHFVEDMALKIRALGYNHKAFLAATEESSKEIQILTDSLVNSISESANFESIKPLIEGLKANSPFIHNLDQVESRETPPPKAIEDKTQKKDTGPKTP